MNPPPSSDSGRGLFVSIDGPSGVGKSTIVAHLTHLLASAGENVYVTAEPSSGPIGMVARELTETVTGHALACLYAADRYHHVDMEIQPKIDGGATVIVDRYIPSGLVMQRFDGVELEFLWQLNLAAIRPDLTVILEADPTTIARRLAERGAHNRFQHSPDSTQTEVRFFSQAIERLTQAGFAVLRVDCNRGAHYAAADVLGALNLSTGLAADENPIEARE